MKKLLTFLLAAMAFVACTQNEVEELTANREALPETLTVGFEGGDTRVELNEALKTVWSKGDEVSVFYLSDANQKWQYQGETGERLGTLKCVDQGVAEEKMQRVVVAYPYNAQYVVNTDTHNLYASLPAVQSYKEGSYGSEGNIMVAQSEFTQFSLKSVVGWLRVELTGEGQKVDNITLRGNAGEQVAGLIYVDTATAEATLATEMGEASDEEEVGGVGGGLEFDDTVFTEVTLDCGNGVELGAEATAFYVALLPQTFDKGVTIEVDYANAEPQTLICESSITIRRNHIAPVNSAVDSELISKIFYTATALVEPYDATAFNVAIVSNEWNEATGEGIITFDGELTTIGEGAFRNCGSLTSVTIPDSVTTIGEGAFRNCYNLTSVTIGDSVTTIGKSAFYWCYSLTNVTIPDSVTTIGDYAFSDCYSLTSVTIGDSVTTIGEYAFHYCSSLTSVTIPDSVTTIGEAAFGGCSNLAEFKGKFAEDGGRCLIKDNTIIAYAEASGTTYTIPDSVTTIGGYAFCSCDSLTSVTIPDSVTTIGINAFLYCTSLTSVTIPDSVTTIGQAAFHGCSNLAEFKGKFAADVGRCLIIDGVLNAFALGCGVTEYTIPDSVTTIGDHAFYWCSSLTSVTIPDSVTTIGEDAFSECEYLTSITIPDSVTTIGDWAFCSCESLTSVTIGDSVMTIGDGAFYWCSSLSSVYCKAIIPPKGINNGYGWRAFDNNASDHKIYVPAESVEAYKAAENWSDYADYIVGYDFEAGEEVAISNKLFYTATALVEPNSSAFNVAIASNEWDETTGEGVITFDGELTTIGDEAFAGCSSLTSVTIGDSVTTIGINAFAFCESLTSVTIPDSVTTIGEAAFCACSSLTSVTIGDSVTTIGASAFDSCTSLTSVTIPDSVTTIGYLAFSNCSSLTSVTIPNSVTTIGYAAFGWCESLTSVTIPDSVTTIGDGAFESCSSLTSVTIPDSVTTIGRSAFYDCDSLTSVTIPDSVTLIGDYAFYSCDSLTSVTIGDSVTKIGNWAFYSCSSLTSVTIPDSVLIIDYVAFANCSNLTTVYCRPIVPPTNTNYEYGHIFDTNIEEFCIYVPEDYVDTYINDEPWSIYADYIVGYPFDDITYEDNKIIKYKASAKIEPYDTSAFGATYLESTWDETTGEGVITFDGNVSKIGDNAFRYCTALQNITIPNSVASIGNYAFLQSGIRSLELSDRVTTIGNYAFHSCYNLEEVALGDNITSIGDEAFSYCGFLHEIDLGSGQMSIGYRAFAGCLIHHITIPENATLHGNVFAGCSLLAKFEGNYATDDGIALISRNMWFGNEFIAFAPACRITEYTIPADIMAIVDQAFYDCDSLTSVTIPDSVTSIGSGAFYDCNALTSVYCKAITPPILGSRAFAYYDNDLGDFVNIGSLIYVPAESVEAYKAAEGWSEYAADIVGYDFETGEVVE